VNVYCESCVTHALQGYNKITDVGTTALAAALKINTCLRELWLVSAGGAKGGGGAVVAAVMRGVARLVVVLLGVYSEGVVELRGGVEGAGCGVMMM